MKIKHRIKFGIKSSVTPFDKNRPGEVRDYPIRMRITYNNSRVDIPIRFGIQPYNWDAAAKKVKDNTENTIGESAADINTVINEYTSIAEDVFKSFELQKTVPSAEMLKLAIRHSYDAGYIDLAGDSKKRVSLSECFRMFKSERGAKNAWTEATFEKFDALWADLEGFNPNLKFDNLTEEGLTDFLIYLRDKKKLRNSTIGKKFDFLKWFLKWATAKGYNKCRDYQEFKPKLKTSQNSVVFLTLPEIKKLCDYHIPESKKHLEKVRDGFVFCCFTSLRYSDLKNLRKADIKDSMIDITTIKTADTLKIDFNSVSRQIIEKYRDYPSKDDRAIPTISNQKMNEQLKELCRLAGIDAPIKQVTFKGNERIEEISPKYELVGTHTGRRSFICNALASGIPVNVVMKWTGHSKYESMKPYIDVADEIREREMTKMNNIDIIIK